MAWCLNPSVQETAAYGFTPDTLLLHPDRGQAMGLRYGLEHAEHRYETNPLSR